MKSQRIYRNYPMFSDAKNNYFGEKQGESENKGCPKTCFCASKNNYFDEKQVGGSKTKGVLKHKGNYGNTLILLNVGVRCSHQLKYDFL